MLDHLIWELDWLRFDPRPGVRDRYGVQWILMEEKGFFGSPEPDVELTGRLNQHGSYRPPGYKRARTITLVGRCYARDLATLRQAQTRVCGLLSDPDTPGQLVCHTEYGSLFCHVFLDGDILCEPLPRTSETGVEFSIQVVAPDPRKYSVATTSTYTGLPSDVGVPSGLDFYASEGPGQLALYAAGPSAQNDATGLDFGTREGTGLNFGDANASGVIHLRNTGTAPSHPRLTLTGPLTTPTVTATGGYALRYNDTLARGETLVIDPSDPSVLLGGTASRRHLVGPAQFTGFVVPPASSPDTPGSLSLGLTHVGPVTDTGWLQADYRNAWF